MKNFMKKLTPNLMVTDVNKTVDFYKDVLDFEVVMTAPASGVFKWALMKNGTVEFMFQSQESMVDELSVLKHQKIGGTFTLYIDVQDIKALYEKINKKVTVVQDFHATPYGTQEFAIQDVNGYILAFAQGR